MQDRYRSDQNARFNLYIREKNWKPTIYTVASENPGSGSPSLCASPETCTLTTNTITQIMYEDGGELDIWRIDIGNDNVDTGYYPITASEMKSKL